MRTSHQKPNPETVTGPREIEVTFEDSRPPEKVLLRQIRVVNLQIALRAFDNDDEVQLISLAIEKPKKFVEELSPESYDALAMAMMEVCRGFFTRLGRRMGARQLTAPPQKETLPKASPTLPPPQG